MEAAGATDAAAAAAPITTDHPVIQQLTEAVDFV